MEFAAGKNQICRCNMSLRHGYLGAISTSLCRLDLPELLDEGVVAPSSLPRIQMAIAAFFKDSRIRCAEKDVNVTGLGMDAQWWGSGYVGIIGRQCLHDPELVDSG